MYNFFCIFLEKNVRINTIMYLGREYSFRLVSKKKNLHKNLCVPARLPSINRPKFFQDIIPPTPRPIINLSTSPEPVITPAVSISDIQSDVQSIQSREEQMEERTDEGIDEGKRSFLKMASIAGLGAVALSVIPKKAEAYVMGSTPASNVVGIKDASNTRVNPATEETLLTIVSGQGVTKKTVTLTGSGTVHTPASGKKVRVYANRFSLSADMSDISFRFTSGGTDFEKYVAPKTGGLYGANNHPNYVEGGVDEVVYCNVNGTGSIQVNLDYLEV